MGSGDRARVRIRAVPGSRTTSVVGPYGDAWKVRVTAAPERGKANAELCGFIARLLGVSVSAVTVVAGGSARDKLVEVDGATTEQVAAALSDAAGL